MALYDYSGLVAPRLSLYNACFHFDSVCFVIWMCSLQLLCSPCAWEESCSTNLQGLGKTRPRDELSTYQQRGRRTYHQTTGWSLWSLRTAHSTLAAIYTRQLPWATAAAISVSRLRNQGEATTRKSPRPHLFQQNCVFFSRISLITSHESSSF